MGSATSGFASNSPVQQKFVSSKGGRKKVPKGLAKIDPERALEIRRMGGLKRQQQLREEKNEQDSIPSRGSGHGSQGQKPDTLSSS